MLARPAGEISAAQVVKCLEGGLGMVPCVEDPSACSKVGKCKARDLWCSVTAAVHETLMAVSIADLVSGNLPRGSGDVC